MCAALVPRVCTASVVANTATASEVIFVIDRVAGASISSSSSSRSLRVGWRRLRSGIGGAMAATAAQEHGGLRHSTQLMGAGTSDRLQRDFLRQNVAFCECRIRVRDACRFSVLRRLPLTVSFACGTAEA